MKKTLQRAVALLMAVMLVSSIFVVPASAATVDGVSPVSYSRTVYPRSGYTDFQFSGRGIAYVQVKRTDHNGGRGLSWWFSNMNWNSNPCTGTVNFTGGTSGKTYQYQLGLYNSSDCVIAYKTVYITVG